MTTVTEGPPRFRVWKDEDDPTYIVQVGDEIYEMDSRAHLPNGVCIYHGPADDLAWTVRSKPVGNVPTGIVVQALRIAYDQE